MNVFTLGGIAKSGSPYGVRNLCREIALEVGQLAPVKQLVEPFSVRLLLIRRLPLLPVGTLDRIPLSSNRTPLLQRTPPIGSTGHFNKS